MIDGRTTVAFPDLSRPSEVVGIRFLLGTSVERAKSVENALQQPDVTQWIDQNARFRIPLPFTAR